MKTFFDPSGIAVIGVSDADGNLGKNIIANLIAWKYPGRVVAVGRRATEVEGVPVVASLEEARLDGVELGIVLTPARTVAGIIEHLGRHGVHRVVIETGGFEELDAGGAQIQNEVLRVARAHEVRIIGPNGVGILDTETRAVVPFSRIPTDIPLGDVAILAQSGGVGLTTLRALAERNIGTRWMACLGNKIDIDEVDLLTHLFTEGAGCAVLYLESMARGRELCELIGAVETPVVVQKANRTPLTHDAAQSHTAALANDDAVVTAALEQAGALRAETTDDLTLAVDATRLPPLRGPRIALLSRSGGHGVIATDACAAEGLELPPFSDAALRDIGAIQGATVIQRGNPLDFGDVFDFDRMAQMLARAADEDIDGIILIVVHSFTKEEPMEALLAEAARLSRASDKPIAVGVVADALELNELRRTVDWPVFDTPEAAVHAMGLSLRRHQARARAALDRIRVELPAQLPSSDAHVWSLARSLELVAAAGIPAAPTVPAAGHSLPYPVAAKVSADSDRVIHKRAAGFIRLDVEDEAALSEVQRKLGAHGVVVVQPMVRGPEIFLGAKRDPSFGPVVLVGCGGSYVELVGDTQVLPYPFSVAEAEHCVARTRLHDLAGDRLDVTTLVRWMAGLGELLARSPELRELDVNPIVLGPDGPMAIDARVVGST